MTVSATAASVRTFAIDKSHSEITFQVRHLVTKVRGRFSDFSGTIQFDRQHPEESSVSFTVDAGSIDTSTADRDAHLKSEDFFFVDRYPSITFDSKGVTSAGNGTFAVRGLLNIRGVEKEITLPVSYLGEAKDPWGQTRVGFEAETTLNRKEFGLTWNTALETGGLLVGDEVKVSLAIQAVAQ